MPRGTALNKRLTILDKWKILIDPKDRTDFEADLSDLHYLAFNEGKELGFKDGTIAEANKVKELPLERGKG
jgi:hypothetical protein